jgi:hypothetical protein
MSSTIDPLISRVTPTSGDPLDDLSTPDAELLQDAESAPDESVPDAEAPSTPDVAGRLARRRRRRRIMRRVALVVAVLMIPVVYSYARALTGPGSDSLQARTVEWARDHHLGFAVDRVEQWWYARHQAPVGGTPAADDQLQLAVPDAPGPSAVSPAGAAPGTSASAGTSAPDASAVAPGDSAPDETAAPVGGTPSSIVAAGTTVAAPAGSKPPAVLQSPATPAVAGEGQWRPLGPVRGGKVGAWVTLIRPDEVHTSSLDAVVHFDSSVFSFRAYPGTKIPGAPWDRPDHVEQDRQASLVAAFAGGFRLADSGGGMLLGGHELQRMKDGVATLTIDANGVPNVGIWGRDMNASGHFDSARQNLSLIVDNGIVAPDLATDANRKWGFTGPKNESAVWRSGAGVAADGSFIWVGGPGLTIEALAETLVRAGAVRGMQLEINQEWAQFNTYATAGGSTAGRKLLPGMEHTGNRWLTEDTRDFVAIFDRAA